MAFVLMALLTPVALLLAYLVAVTVEFFLTEGIELVEFCLLGMSFLLFFSIIYVFIDDVVLNKDGPASAPTTGSQCAVPGDYR